MGVVFPSQVRAAAVFALGTYIMNIPEDGQSDLSISIDHSVGMRLLTLVNDGSPIVRRVSPETTRFLVRIHYHLHVPAVYNYNHYKLSVNIHLHSLSAGGCVCSPWPCCSL